ncbi:MAG: hypothetical protein AB7V16_11860 [Vulcanibacillus sp.]
MGKNYRDIYESYYNVKLRPGISSIHHLDFCNSNSHPKNLVAISQELHDKLNITVSKFPKLLKILLRCQIYWLVKNKNLIELESHIKVYLQLNKFIQIRNVIKKYGINHAIEVFNKNELEEIYVLENKERIECA